MAQKTSWTSKLDEPANIEIKPVPEGRKHYPAGQLMFFPNGRAVAAFIRTIPVGQSMTTKELRAAMAREHGADVTCPFTIGICLRTVAEAAYEAFDAGAPLEDVTPVWRVLDAKAPTLKKVSFDPAFIHEQRMREAL